MFLPAVDEGSVGLVVEGVGGMQRALMSVFEKIAK